MNGKIAAHREIAGTRPLSHLQSLTRRFTRMANTWQDRSWRQQSPAMTFAALKEDFSAKYALPRIGRALPADGIEYARMTAPFTFPEAGARDADTTMPEVVRGFA